MNLIIKLVAVAVLCLGDVWASCQIPNNQSYDMEFGEQTQIESLQGADITVTFWHRFDGNTSQGGQVFLAYIGTGASEAEADNSILFFRCDLSTCQEVEWIWEYSGGSNTVLEMPAADYGGSWNDVWLYWSFSRDVSANEVVVWVWRQDNETWYTTTESYTNDGTGGGSGNLYVFDNEADANQSDSLSMADIRIYDYEMSENEMKQNAFFPVFGPVFHLPLLNCSDNLHIGDGSNFTTTGSGEQRVSQPPIVSPFGR